MICLLIHNPSIYLSSHTFVCYLYICSPIHYPYTHTITHLCIHSPSQPAHSAIHSPMYPLLHTSMTRASVFHSLAHPSSSQPGHPFSHLSTHSFIHLLTHQPSSHSSIYPFSYPSVYPYIICPSICPSVSFPLSIHLSPTPDTHFSLSLSLPFLSSSFFVYSMAGDAWNIQLSCCFSKVQTQEGPGVLEHAPHPVHTGCCCS